MSGKFITFQKATSFSVMTVLVLYSTVCQAGIIDIRAERLTSSKNMFPKAVEHTLSPSLRTAPLYAVERAPDGSLRVTPPSGGLERDIYTEVLLAMLGSAAANDISDGPFVRYMKRVMGGDTLGSCRIMLPRRQGDVFSAVYAPEEGGSLYLLRFSECGRRLPETAERECGVIKLADDTRITVKIDPLGAVPQEWVPDDREVLVMKHEIKDLLLNEKDAEGAVRYLFTSPAFQGQGARAFADTVNMLLEARTKGVFRNQTEKDEAIESFLRKTLFCVPDFSSDPAVAEDVQLIAGQALTVMSWIKRGVKGASGIRVTVDFDKTVRNDRRGKSFIDASTLPEGILPVARQEGQPGMYWRGVEKIGKLGPDVIEGFIFDRKRFCAASEGLVMYLMDHGFLPVGPGMISQTEAGEVSTIHETFFLRDRLPGSCQAVSTGPGHFQAERLDIKHVTEGEGIQFNVRYNGRGGIEGVFAQRVQKGDYTLALPGCVDYVVNLGGLRFNDISVGLDGGTAAGFNPQVFSAPEVYSSVAEAVKGAAATSAPYLVASAGGGHYLFRNRAEAPEVQWLPRFEGSLRDRGSLVTVYNSLDEERLSLLVREALECFRNALCDSTEHTAPVFSGEEIKDRLSGEEAPSFEKTEAISGLIAANESWFHGVLSSREHREAVVRVPVELFRTLGGEDAARFLKAMDASDRIYIELFSLEGIGAVGQESYSRLGLSGVKRVPEYFRYSRSNTVTLLPVRNKEEITVRGRGGAGWGIGGIRPTDTILMPVGYNFDRAGIIRSVIFGLKLTQAARSASLNGDGAGELLKILYTEIALFCVSQSPKGFDLAPQDLHNLASGDINRMVRSLNMLIASLPIIPLNAEEQRILYEKARKVLLSA